MIKAKFKRALTLVALISCISIGVWILIENLNKNMMFFYTPTEIKNSTHQLGSITVGGIVKPGSIEKSYLDNMYTVRFTITDCANDLKISYNGLLPSLFREKQGIVAIGKLSKNGEFNAKQLLAKHDEYYSPKELNKNISEDSICNPQNYKS